MFVKVNSRQIFLGQQIFLTLKQMQCKIHLFNSVVFDAAARSEAVRDWLRAEQYEQVQHDDAHAEAACDHPHHGQAGHQCATDAAAPRHDQRIHSFCLRFSEPFEWPEVAAWLDSLVSVRGADLLRVKGLIHVRGDARPVVVHQMKQLYPRNAFLNAFSACIVV